MLILAVLAVVAVLILGAVLTLLARRDDVVGEVSRFHHARELTTAWSQERPPAAPRSHPAPSPDAPGDGS